jgi:hypothetical protein
MAGSDDHSLYQPAASHDSTSEPPIGGVCGVPIEEVDPDAEPDVAPAAAGVEPAEAPLDEEEELLPQATQTTSAHT